MSSKLFLIAGIVLQTPALLAQHNTPPEVKISVHDAAGAPIANAAVALQPASIAVHTGTDGAATFLRTSETVQLRVSAPGYEGKTVETGLFSTIDVILKPSPGAGTTSSGNAGDLTLTAAAGSQSLSLADLAKLPHRTLTVQNGHTHASETYSGVPLIDLFSRTGAPTGGDVRGKALSEYIIVTGSDGYRAVLSLGEIEPDFHPGTVLVADAMNGKPLDAKEGPFKLVVSEDTKPARSVHNLVSLELKQAE